jgi:hypothetical protein
MRYLSAVSRWTSSSSAYCLSKSWRRISNRDRAKHLRLEWRSESFWRHGRHGVHISEIPSLFPTTLHIVGSYMASSQPIHMCYEHDGSHAREAPFTTSPQPTNLNSSQHNSPCLNCTKCVKMLHKFYILTQGLNVSSQHSVKAQGFSCAMINPRIPRHVRPAGCGDWGCAVLAPRACVGSAALHVNGE